VHSPVLSRNRTTSAERRRHVRHRFEPFSTIVVQLGPNNGGNLLDIGAGGLSLQAVAKLRPEVELNLRFRLQGTEYAVEAVGRVTWLGPTQKVAGISFKNLPESTEQKIVEWVARQAQSARNNPSSKFDNSRLPPSPISPHRIRRTKPDPLPPPSLPSSLDGVNSQKQIVLPLHKSLESLAEHSEPLLETITLSESAVALSSRRSVSLDPSLISPDEANSTYRSERDRLRESFASESRWHRRKIAIAVMVGVVGILALFARVANPDRLSSLKAVLGMGVAAKMDPAKASVPVWAVPRDGFFYCANDPNFQKIEPGGMMTQGEAVQNTYKPKLGYCQ
jgi:hypothetical protein